jgi:hypothetical protein
METKVSLQEPMEQSHSWEANSHSASQEISPLSWNPNVHYRFYNSSLLVPILSQMSPVHTFQPYFPNSSVFCSLCRSKESVQFRSAL